MSPLALFSLVFLLTAGRFSVFRSRLRVLVPAREAASGKPTEPQAQNRHLYESQRFRHNTRMLRELSVQNLALIEDVRVELHSGFCAWTGETGAGKTLLLSALNLLLGERGQSDLIRTGTEELRVVGVFELTDPELRRLVRQLLDSEQEDDQIILLRRLTRSGRSSAYVNEQPVSITTLRQLGTLLVGIHGQRESQSLLDSAYQTRLLDAFGGLQPLRARYQSCAETVRELRRRRAALLAERQQRQRELALVRFEREELDAAELVQGEKAELTRERQRLQHALSLCTFAATGCARLYDEEGSLYEQLGKLQRDAEKWSALDPQLQDIERRLLALGSEVQDLAETLRDLAQHWQADPERQETVDDRLQLLNKLESKYGKSIEELVAYRATLDEQETQLQQQEDDLKSMDGDLTKAFDELRQAGSELSAQRQKAAKRLATEVAKHLADLGMKEAKLEAVLEPVPLGADAATAEVPGQGLEQLELLLAANRGEPALPLRKVASGGELSRTMLALKTVLAAQDHVGTLVFDEIDANVGGRLGDVLGQKLASLGQTHQIICVTHLPQVASYARHQWTIRKTKRGKRTVTTIEPLNEADRLDELASMLRGEARGETTRQEAAAMLAAARERW
jgi:DNA repair protein RecN (Recombination protein N)